jgi:hypothetical protein
MGRISQAEDQLVTMVRFPQSRNGERGCNSKLSQGVIISAVPAFNDFTFVRVSDVVQKYGTLWRTMHRMIYNILNVRAAATYIPHQGLENKQILLDIMDRPAEFVNHIR